MDTSSREFANMGVKKYNYFMDKDVFSYFNKAFFLVNKNWSLVILYLLLSLSYSLPEFLGDSFIKDLLQFIGFLMVFIQMGYSFSLPIFLVDRQQEKSVNFKNLLLITCKNTKRLIIPLILIFIIFIIILITGYFLAVYFIYGGDYDFMTKIQGFNLWNLLIALIMGLFSFLTFSPVYFSLENNGLLLSIKKSITLSLRHLEFILILALIEILTYLVLINFLNTSQNLSHSLIYNIIYAYLGLITTSASLYLYQKHKV